MTDELDRLRAALKDAGPTPDAARRAEAMARAMAEFDRVQGSAGAARPRSDRPLGAAWTGVRAMLSALTTRAGLAGGASLAVIALAIVVAGPEFAPPRPVAPPAPQPAEVAQPKAPATPEADAPGEAGMRSRTAAEDTAQATGETAGGAPALQSAPAAEPEPGAAMLADEDALTRTMPVAPPPADLGIAEQSRAADAVAPTARREMAPLGGIAPAPTLAPDMYVAPQPDTEAFPEADRNPLKVTAEDPVSTFSIDVDTASWGIVRSSLNAGYLPPPGAVRIEEMVNYFPYDWPAPAEDGDAFRSTVSVMQTPWNEGTRLVTVALKGRMPAIEDRPPLNLVFLIDTSGSMQDANRLPLLKQSLRLMLPELRPEDQIAIVAYAGSAGRVLDPTPAGERETILAALDRLEAGGSTAGQEGLALAYATARGMAAEGEVTRVLLATDGDFNVGISDPDELTRYIAREREGGTYLSVLGFGRGNLDDATMQALAQNGNGTAAYIDTLNEARKVLVDELTGALFPIADDVKIQVEWNPAAVAEWRLIGYETRALAREDFANDRVDAGEIGAGHTVTALYEVTPVGSPARRTDPLRYGEATATGDASELGFLRLRWKAPGEDASRLVETPIPADAAQSGEDARFAAAIAGMGQLLGDPKYLGDWGWDEAIALASGARGEDPFGYRAEAVGLMRLAQSLSR